MFEISAQNGLGDVILGSEGKTSDFSAHFSRNSGAGRTVLFTIQMFNEHSVICFRVLWGRSSALPPPPPRPCEGGSEPRPCAG